MVNKQPNKRTKLITIKKQAKLKNTLEKRETNKQTKNQMIKQLKNTLTKTTTKKQTNINGNIQDANIDKTRKKIRQDKCVLAGWQDRTVPLQINASTK